MGKAARGELHVSGMVVRDGEETLITPRISHPEEPVFPVPGWDRYSCIRFLGQGAMGNVFLARDARLQRDVAIKFVRGNEPAYIRRLLVEARAQARVEHACVCKVYEVGEAMGHVYIAMQHIQGAPLHQCAGELSFEQKAMLVRDVAQGMHTAHAVGVVHRDIKPGNILVERGNDGSLRPYVMDFGIAHLYAGGATEAGAVLGTPHYMAPEQARGETDTLDRRADVYGLGATLYFLLTGEPPLGGDQAMEVLHRIAEQEPRPPRELAPDVPADLSAIALKCLEKERARRYDSARALAEDLDRFLRGEPVVAHHATGLGRARRWLRKHRRVVLPLLAALAMALGAALVSGLLNRETRRHEQLAHELTERALVIEAMARYSALSPPHDITGDRERLRAAMDALAADIEKAGAGADIAGHEALGRGYLALGDRERAEPHLVTAWNASHRNADTALALGLVKGHRYRAVRTTAGAGRGAQARESERDDRAAAIAYLRTELDDSGPLQHYMRALAAYYEGRSGEALDHLEQLGAGLPWRYEVPELRGDILFERAARRWAGGDVDGAALDFESARQAFAWAITIGRSVPRLHESQARLSHAEMVWALGRHQGAEPNFRRGMAELDEALALEPGRETALALAARLERRFAEGSDRPACAAAPDARPGVGDGNTDAGDEALDAFLRCTEIELPSP